MLGSRGSTSGSWINFTEDEIFRSSIVNQPWGGEGFGDSAGDYPLALRYWKDRAADIFETFLSDLNSAHGVEVHAEAVGEAVRQSTQPVCVPHSMEIWPNGGLNQAVQEYNSRPWQRHHEYAASSSNVISLDQPCITFGQSLNYSPQRSRRPAGRWPPDANPDATRDSLVRRRGANPEARNYEHPVALPSTNPRMIIPGFSSMLRLPFDVSYLPPDLSIMYPRTLNTAHVPQAPNIRVHNGPFSGPDVDSAVVTATRPINPVQEQVSVAVDLQNEPPMSSDLECQHIFNHPSSTTTRTCNPVQEEPVSMAIQYERLMSSDSECQLDFNYPSPTTTTIYDLIPAQEQVSMEVEYGPALSLHLEQQVDFNYQSPDSTNWGIQEVDLWGPSNSIGSPIEQVPDQPAVQELAAEVRRFRWTSELHKEFLAAVEKLGGPDKATPKSVLLAMDCGREINIFHVKSHLQKFRLQVAGGIKQQHDLSITSERNPYDGETSEMEKEMEETLNRTIEKYKDLSRLVGEQNLQMRQLLAFQQAHSFNMK